MLPPTRPVWDAQPLLDGPKGVDRLVRLARLHAAFQPDFVAALHETIDEAPREPVHPFYARAAVSPLTRKQFTAVSPRATWRSGGRGPGADLEKPTNSM
jgi:hypothetical protein